MHGNLTKEKRILEFILILVCLGLACLLYAMQGYKMVILNLFFLPIALGGLFLGRYRAGILALFCAVSASCVTALRLPDLAPSVSGLVIALAVTVWAAVLGLTALLIGTLSDDRTKKLKQLHEAYVGVVEVLAQYLQSAHPQLKARSIRVAEDSQRVALAMKLSPADIDDIRVAALLYDMGNIEVTTKVIRRAVDMFEGEHPSVEPHTFQGMDLMLSLGSVLRGAVRLLLNQDESMSDSQPADEAEVSPEVPLGTKIICAVRAYAKLAETPLGIARLAPGEIIQELRENPAASFDADVLNALERVMSQTNHDARVPALEEDTSRQFETPVQIATR